MKPLLLISYYGILSIPLVFWCFWQTSSLLAWLSIVACLVLVGLPYRDAIRADWSELFKHTKSESVMSKIGVKFGGKTFSALLFCCLFLIPNFLVFWMYLSRTDFIFWVFFAIFPLIFVAIKQNFGALDSNRAILLNTFWVASFPSVILALLESFVNFIIDPSKMDTQVGADFILDYFSAFFHWWSEIVDNFLSLIFSFLPWTEFWVTLFSNLITYWGVFFALALMLHLLPFNFGGNKCEGKGFIKAFFKTIEQLIQDKKVILTVGVFLALLTVAIFAKENRVSSTEANQQKIEVMELGVAKILGKDFRNMVDISELKNQNPDDIRCGWFRRYILFGIGCAGQDIAADTVEKLQKNNKE